MVGSVIETWLRRLSLDAWGFWIGCAVFGFGDKNGAGLDVGRGQTEYEKYGARDDQGGWVVDDGEAGGEHEEAENG